MLDPLEEQTISKRNKLKIMDHIIGTYDDWDGDHDCMTFYAFKPCAALADDMPEGDVSLSWVEGVFEFLRDDDDGVVNKTISAMKILSFLEPLEG